jgi:DNA-binding response OmpR family regulator
LPEETNDWNVKKILIIEDNPDIRENTAEILALANYQTLTAENGKIGIETAQREKPDLIICDIMMPELDGFGVLHVLNKDPDLADVPFIFLTAKGERNDIRKGMESGADDYLTKPFDDTELLNAIETRLRKHDIRARSYGPGVEGFESFVADARHALQIKDLCKDRRIKEFKKKSEIYAEGDNPAYVYYLKSGHVKEFKGHPDGKEFITNLYKEGDFFGFEPILENTPYKESAIAMRDSEVMFIPRQDFLTLLYGQRDVSAGFISLLCRKVAEREAQLLNLAYSSVRQRTAEALLKITHLRDSKDKIEISRDDLSKIVGTASESVIRVLSEFKDEGLIDIDAGKIKILQPAKLEKVIRWNFSR